jgi:hypothetical protein
MGRPRSSRFENKHAPWPSCQMILTRSPRHQRKTNRWPACGSTWSLSCTSSASPGKPRRISVWPAANHTRVPTGTGIMRHRRGPRPDVPYTPTVGENNFDRVIVDGFSRRRRAWHRCRNCHWQECRRGFGRSYIGLGKISLGQIGWAENLAPLVD